MLSDIFPMFSEICNVFQPIRANSDQYFPWYWAITWTLLATTSPAIGRRVVQEAISKVRVSHPSTFHCVPLALAFQATITVTKIALPVSWHILSWKYGASKCEGPSLHREIVVGQELKLFSENIKLKMSETAPITLPWTSSWSVPAHILQATSLLLDSHRWL